MNWKPIETAPKDGTLIIGYPFFDRVCLANFEHDGWFVDANSQDGMGFYRIGLTHWMPLPPPPNES